MTIEPRLDIIGAALAHPSRSRILCELMDGRAFTNKELAAAASVSPQTASGHLAKLDMAGLTTSLRSGRHVYHRIAGAEVAGVLERLAGLSPTDHLSRYGRTGTDTRRARSCYDHIAGRLGVLMTDRLIAREVLDRGTGGISPGPGYVAFVDELGAAVRNPGARKPVVKLCLDWTERRDHISGPLANAIFLTSLEKKWIERRTGDRALTVTKDGVRAFERLFGIAGDEIEPPARAE